MLIRAPLQGFTLIELLVALTIAGFLMALGLPALTGYLQNAKVGSVTQTLHSSLQAARTEAIRRNLPVDFITTNLAVTASGVADAPSPSATGRNWIVRVPDPAASGSFELLDARSTGEGSPSTGASGVLVAASGAFTGTITFNGFGGTTNGAGFSFDITNPAAGSCATTGPVRCMRVRVSPGGQVSTCDPAVTLATDSRFCTP